MSRATPPGYRERLLVEGGFLAGCGVLACVLLLALAPGATDGAQSTVVQLVLVAVFMALAGPRAVRRWMSRAVRLDPAAPGDGQPTALWVLAVICAGLTLLFGLGAWEAGLRAAGGCAVVGAAQALLSRLVALEESRTGVRFVRVPGSSLLRGTRLGRLPSSTSV